MVTDDRDALERLAALMLWCQTNQAKIVFLAHSVTVTVGKISRTAPTLVDAIETVRKERAS